MAETPPLQAVRVFDAVARHLNFTKAATELNMTQSAVSYQVKLLESFIGAPLFVREARGVALSEQGRMVAPMVRRALNDLTQAFLGCFHPGSTVTGRFFHRPGPIEQQDHRSTAFELHFRYAPLEQADRADHIDIIEVGVDALLGVDRAPVESGRRRVNQYVRRTDGCLHCCKRLRERRAGA